jgi:hypothetical protein
MFDYRLGHITSYTATLQRELEVIGLLAEDLRANAYISGGKVRGPKLSGKLRPVRGGWLTVRTEEIVVLAVRATIETHDGALIYLAYIGIVDMGETGYRDFVRGQLPASGTPIHSPPRFHSSHLNHLWLNRLHCIGIGRLFFECSEVAFDVCAVR